MVLAHGIGGRSDLPVPTWLAAYGAGAVVAVSFAALLVLWPRPRLAAVAAGSALPGAVQRQAGPGGALLGAVGVALFAVVLSAALFGTDDAAANVAPVAVYVVFWVGLLIATAVVGNVWAVASPFVALARLLPDRRRVAWDPGHRTAAALLASFAWLELCWHDPADPRAVAAWLVAYTAAVVAGVLAFGRAWAGTGEGFAGLFGLLGHLAPLHRGDDGRLRLRPPLAGLAALRPLPGTTALVLVALGSTTFDGVQRTAWWADRTRGRRAWSLTAVNTLGMAAVIAAVAAAWWLATVVASRVAGRPAGEVGRDFVPSLVPIVLAYAVAHYFSLLWFESRNALALASDPYGRGWDLFGTVGTGPDYRSLSTGTIAAVQVVAIVAGHVAGVVAAHDRAVERFPARLAVRTQWPLLAVMVAYTVGGLALLLGG
jgi:hypothetical protein